MKKTILIAGGSGFIGYHLAKKALKRKYSVSIISTKRPFKKRHLKKVKYIYCDVTNKKKLKKKLNQNYDYIVNLAGYVNHQEKTKTYNSHYKGCKNLADIFIKKNLFLFYKLVAQRSMDILRPHTLNLQNVILNQTTQKQNLMLKIILKGYLEKINLSLML